MTARAIATLPTVFLSYARGDDASFAEALHDALREVGGTVWWDRASMPSRALTFLQEIRDAIDGHDRLVLVVGPKALESDYVTAEWRYALEAGKVVVPLIRLLPKDKKVSETLPRELRRLHAVEARADRRSADETIGELLRQLREPAPPLGPLLYVPKPPPHYQPRPEEMHSLEDAIGLDRPEKLAATPRDQVVVLHGMGGVGKTVIAASFARSIGTRRQFPGGVVWVDAGSDADIVGGLRRIGRAVAADLREFATVDDAVEPVRAAIANTPLLVVADNAADDKTLAPFCRVLSPAARLLVTTRDVGLATTLGAADVDVGLLSEEEALHHLGNWVGAAVDDLPEAARVVAAECDGLPLAICLAGAMARAGTSWVDLGEALRSADLSFVSARLPADLYPHTSLLRALQVSVDALRASSDPEQRIAAERYFDLGPLRWDEGVPEATVVTVWRARGGLRPQDARKLVSVLASKALLRTEGVSPGRTLRLHDLLHDFIRGSVDDLAAEHGAYVDAVAAVVPEAPFVSDDFYYLDHLAYHLAEARRVDELHELLACETANGAHAWWETRLAHGQVSGFVDDVRRASAAATHSVALTARYALVMGSVRSAVGEVWAELAELFVEHEMWTPAQVLAAADWAEGAHSRFALLLVALRRLEAPEREAVVSEAAVMARQEPEDQDRARRLIELAGALGDEGNEYLEEALQVVAVAGVRGSAYLYADAFAARPSRTDLFDAALRLLEPEHDDLTLRTAVEQLAPRAPISRLERLARVAATVGSPNERAHALLAVSEREDFEGRAEAVAGARDATELVNEPRREARLLARLARFLPDDQGRAVAGRALAVVDALNARDSFGVALDVLPFVEGDQRVHAERIALTVERLSPQDLAEVLANESRVRTLREREPELYRLLVDSAVRAVAANPDARRRGLTLRRVLALAPTETAVSALRDEARRILLIDDAEYASRCLADVASQLDRLQSADAVGARIDRLLARLEPNEVVRPVTPLLALADVARLRAVESAAAEADTRFDLDFRPALAAAWAQLGDWDRALSALDGASPFELAKAIELFGELPEAVARALLQWAIEARDPELFAGVVAAAADLPEPERSGCARLAIEAAAALDNPSTRCSLIKRALASAPCELVGELGALLLDDDVGLEQEQALAELTRAHIRCGDAAGVVAATRRLGYIETILPLQLEAQQTFGLDGEAEFLDRAESDARALRGPSRVELLVEIAKHSPERRERLLREATLHARDPASFEGWPGQRAQAESLALVAGEHVGEEHTNLLLEAWRLAPAAGSSEGVDVLRELGPSLASLAPDVLLEPWREGLAAASRSRRAVFEELGALAPVAAALGGHDEMQRIVTALDDVDRWWPSLPNVF